MLADYHLHCVFSDDSWYTPEKVVADAWRQNLDEICFTDHVDYGIKKDWDEGGIEYRGGDGIGLAAEELQPLANVD